MDVDLPLWAYRAAWWSWIAWFLVWETLALLDSKPGDTLTENVRPLMHAHPLVWFVAAGFVAWIAVHFLAPSVEQWIVDTVLRHGRGG